MDGGMNEWVSEGMSEWVSEWMNEWMNEWDIDRECVINDSDTSMEVTDSFAIQEILCSADWNMGAVVTAWIWSDQS